MSLYARWLLPQLIHGAMRAERLTPLRRRAVTGLGGRVLEIGIGSGLNLAHYEPAVVAVTGIDPAPALLARAAAQPRRHFALELIEGRAETLPLPRASFEAAVVTWTLCSVADPAAALAELRRVLVPGGTLSFVEHGRAADLTLARWQRRLSPLWRRIAGGCQLDRDPPALLDHAGFRLDALECGWLVAGPRLVTWHFAGRARRPADG
jgi:ubiquinone/menaquinone biosynthesis C-methylase UbiE